MVIPQELETFSTKMSSGLSNMNTALTDLQEKLTKIFDATKNAQDGIDANYKSSNKSSIINKFSKISMLSDTINNSLSSDMKTMLKKSQDIVDKVELLKNYNKTIDEQDSIIYSENRKDEPNGRIISNANSKKREATTSFNDTLSEAQKLLDELKAMDADLDFVTQFSSNDYLNMLDQLEWGSFEQKTYKASNGVKVNYWLYEPGYGTEVENLPLHIYMHGSGETYAGTLKHGLPLLINNKQVTPEGYVIALQASEYRDFSSADYFAAVKELCDTMVEENKVDGSKISLSGHSMGAIGGYKFVAQYPDYFSAFVPISGLCFNTEKLLNDNCKTRIWIFHGRRDSNCEYSNAVSTYNTLLNGGANVQMYTYDNEAHAGVQEYTFEREFEDENDETVNVLSWCYEQTNEEKA